MYELTLSTARVISPGIALAKIVYFQNLFFLLSVQYHLQFLQYILSHQGLAS